MAISLPPHPSRRQVLAATFAGLLTSVCAEEPAQPKPVAPKPAPKSKADGIVVSPDAVTGPMVGHTSDRESHLWIRPAKPGSVTLTVSTKGAPDRAFSAEAEPAHDLCVAIRVPDLKPATDYTFRFEQAGVVLGTGRFRTWAAPEVPAKVTIGLGSCVDIESSPIWTTMRQSGCEAFVFMGDTPYIDSYDLATVRRRHREFLHVPELQPLLAQMPFWGTWDDHDFGLNSHLGNSNPAGKQRTRQGFLEYRANASHGENNLGVYTSFRVGALEVWLLDPRWFSLTEPSPVDPKQPSCFGGQQWKWMLASLKASAAPFKLLAMGEVWQDKMNKETDDLGTFPYEREGLFDYLKKEKIPGVFLYGGDIHCSRHLCTKGRVGYDLHEFVSSPMHHRVLPSLNIPHPDLVWGHPEPRSFLRLTVDSTVQPPQLTASFLNVDGKIIHEVQLTSSQLAAT